MSARFELSTLEASLGGNLKSPLFDLETYGQQMKVGRVGCLGHPRVQGREEVGFRVGVGWGEEFNLKGVGYNKKLRGWQVDCCAGFVGD